MYSVVVDNPFRILGVTSEASLKAINANMGKMRALATVGRAIVMPLDMNDRLPAARHDPESLEAAKNAISLKNDRLKHALCWLVNTCERDDEALRALGESRLADAAYLWKNPGGGFAAHFNLATLRLLQDNVAEAINEMELATADAEASRLWLAAVDCADAPDATDLFVTYVQLLLPMLGDDDINELLRDGHLDDHAAQVVNRLASGGIHDLIVDEVARCGVNDDTDYQESAFAIELLTGSTLGRLDRLKALWGEDNPDYCLLADNVARTLSECAIRFHNKAYLSLDKKRSMLFLEQAREIASSPLIKHKCNKEIYAIEGFQYGDPPLTLSQHRVIIDILEKKDDNKSLHDTLRQLLECALPLCQIHDKIVRGTDAHQLELYFPHISSRVASHFGHRLLDELNRLKNLPAVPNPSEVIAGRLIVKCLQKLQLSKAYRQYEFDELIQRITEHPFLFLKADRELLTDDDVWSTAGLFDFGTADEVFGRLHTEAQMDLFLNRFPGTRYASEIKRQRRLKREEERAARAADEQAWQQVKTRRQARKYLAQYPRGAHVAEANEINLKGSVRSRRLKKVGTWLLIAAAATGAIGCIYHVFKYFSFWSVVRVLGFLGLFSVLFEMGGSKDKNNSTKGCGCILILTGTIIVGAVLWVKSCSNDSYTEDELTSSTLAGRIDESAARAMIANDTIPDYGAASSILNDFDNCLYPWYDELRDLYDTKIQARLDDAGWDSTMVSNLYNEIQDLYATHAVDELVQRHDYIERFGEHAHDSDDKAWRALNSYDTYDAYDYYTHLFPMGYHIDEAVQAKMRHTHYTSSVVYHHRYENGKMISVPIVTPAIKHD